MALTLVWELDRLPRLLAGPFPSRTLLFKPPRWALPFMRQLMYEWLLFRVL